MTSPVHDQLVRAKTCITEWIHGLQVAGSHLGAGTRQELLKQLELALPVVRHDGSLELVLPGLSSLGVGIFQRSFRVDESVVRVVPYGVA